MTKARLMLTITLITLVINGLAGCSSTPDVDTSPDSEIIPLIGVGPQVGKLAPDFEFTDAEGNSTSLSNLRDKYIILNFWQTWCQPCKYEMPLLQDLAYDQEKADNGLILLTVNSGESADTVQRFMKERGFSFPVLLDVQKGISRSYNVRFIPTTFFIGRDGIISNIRVGAFMNEDQLEKILNTFIK
jgi:peroxiredoxin